MVKMKKGLWFFLLVFSVYLSHPGYTATKSINIKDLPANQDMDMASQEYGEGEKTLGVTDDGGDCIGSECLESLNETAKCNKCVELQDACPDCCLTDNTSGDKVVKCSEGDDNGDYVCEAAPFDEDSCDPVVCNKDKCFSECSNYAYEQFEDDGKTQTACYETKGTAGEVDSSAKPRRWQKRGCPEKDSADLAPNGSCSPIGTGSGLDRKWKCTSDWLKPKFAVDYIDKSLCAPDSDLTFTNSKPDSTWGYGDYYAVTKVSPLCDEDDTCESECSVSCKVKKDSCSPVYPDTDMCSPSACTPECPDACSYSCVSGTACEDGKEDKSTSDCSCAAEASCTPRPCDTECSTKCWNRCSNSCPSGCEASSDDYYVYVLSDKYQKYIKECIDKANEYEECADSAHCCQEGACPDELDGEDKCNPGFEANCDSANCEKRVCPAYVSMCEAYTGTGTITSCAQLASDANGCLVDHKDCFKEIDEDFPYHDFVARSGESLTIIWQIVNKPPEEIVSGVNFYTLVKVWELDSSGETDGKLVHTSMANVKSLEAAFSIYGTTYVPGKDLEAGKLYRAKVYYFLPNAEFCDPNCETCAATNEVELSYLSLIVLRVRE